MLTFPEPITPFNVVSLRQAVINGPDVHPGATMIQDSTGQMIDLSRRSRQERIGLSKRLLVNVDTDGAPAIKLKDADASAEAAGGGGADGAAAKVTLGKTKAEAVAPSIVRGGTAKVVWRHLRDGDALLLNRQPTLHKPGIMAHRARVLHGEKVIRMHYANCNTYNADFDGDEMNVHMVQTELARAEAYEIASTEEQYIAPTNGKPLRGLIQDHVIMGVLLTKRDTFLEASVVMQLLQLAHMDLKPTERVAPLPIPAILKPRPLWTGKQVISHLLRHLHPDATSLNMECATKTPASAWTAAPGRGKPDPEDAVVIVRHGELLAGVLDKAAFGATEFGLVHSVFEVLGPGATGQLLTQLGKLFTGYQQMHGFTCGIGDLLLTDEADSTRAELLRSSDSEGLKGVRKFLGAAAPPDEAPRAELRAAIEHQILKGEASGAILDGTIKEKLMPLASQLVAACLPSGQLIPFPKNNFAAMTSTGAKGSGVNFSQISVMLGQQELEGRRVPLSPSGCTAPCFAPYELGARAGGYITDRFLTGVRPPEFYFHCMAGREGLVDTAVKTSRSGYLQRCLIKHLEPLQVAYDYTVRSTTDGSVVQFVAGEDGLDPTRVSFLQKPDFYARNAHVLLRKWQPPARAPRSLTAAYAIEARAARISAEREALAAKKASAAARAADPLQKPLPEYKEIARGLPPRLSTAYPTALGAVSELYDETIDKHVPKLNAEFGGAIAEPGAKRRASGAASGTPSGRITEEEWRVLMWRKYHAALHHPGEAVGLLAAQSVGEPSTQMTLNTFHLAGRGEANVTLGIPRMREIIMVASKKPSTPLMTLQLAQSTVGVAAAEAERLASRLASQLTRLKLSEMVAQVTCEERLRPERSSGSESSSLRLRRRALVHIRLGKKASVSAAELSQAFVLGLMPLLKQDLKKKMKLATKKGHASDSVGRKRAGRGGGVDGDREGVEEDDGGDDDAPDAPADAEPTGGDGADGAGGAASGVEDNADDDADDAKASNRAATQGEGADYDSDDSDDDNDEAPPQQPYMEEDGNEDEDDETSPSRAPARNELSARLETARAQILINHGGWGFVDFGEVNEDGSPATSTSTVPGGHASGLWLDLELPIEGARILLLPLVEATIEKVLVRSTTSIASAVVVPAGKGKALPTVQTAGVNFAALAAFKHLIDLNEVRSNDIHAVLQFYGVEAARATIVNEIRSVFGVYGIAVDPRHLGLIADYMTHEGAYKPLNRSGIESNASPLLKMSFETTMHFMQQSVLLGEKDTLDSHSASIILGKPPQCGTGSFELQAHLKMGDETDTKAATGAAASGAAEDKAGPAEGAGVATAEEAKKLTVPKLKAELEQRGLATDGLKPALLARLLEALTAPPAPTPPASSRSSRKK